MNTTQQGRRGIESNMGLGRFWRNLSSSFFIRLGGWAGLAGCRAVWGSRQGRASNAQVNRPEGQWVGGLSDWPWLGMRLGGSGQQVLQCPGVMEVILSSITINPIIDDHILFSFVIWFFFKQQQQQKDYSDYYKACVLISTAVCRDDNAWEIFNDELKIATSPHFVLASFIHSI